MKKELTDRQQDILRFIEEFRDNTGYPPTLREIGKKFGISSTFGVKRHLDALVKKGFLTQESNTSRGLSIVKDKSEEPEAFAKVNPIVDTVYQIPIIGRVAAGVPITAIENMEGSVMIDSTFMKKSADCFALKVKGDSMINAGILEGDLVIVKPQTEILNSEIVVAIIRGEATVKRFEKKKNMIRLIPENSNYSPIEVTETDEFSVAGKVIGVVRTFIN
jgi:repressor LexA